MPMAGLRVDPGNFLRGMSQVQQRQLFAIETYGKAVGNKMIAHVKKSHPWHNRTYSAERTATSSAEWHGNVMRIALSSGVSYGVYLEFKRFKHVGNLAIYFPTVRKFAPEALAGWAERMKGG